MPVKKIGPEPTGQGSTKFSVEYLDDIQRIANDVKKEFHFCKDVGAWYWSDRDECDNMAAWHGPFLYYTYCVLDAVSPYLEKEE